MVILTIALEHLDSHPPICPMTSLVRACLTFYMESYQGDIGCFMAALCNRAGHIHFHAVVSSSFFSSPNLCGRRLDVYHTSTHGVALV